MRLPRLQMTVRQMIKLVIIAAFASAAVAPAARLKDIGGTPSWWTVVAWGAIAAPLASALVAFPLVQKGPQKDWLIRVLLMASVAAAFGLAAYFSGLQVYLMVFRGTSLYGSSLTTDACVAVVLGAALTFLLARVIPRWCPDCKSPMLIPDVPSHAKADAAPAAVCRCLACDGRFSKLHGAWTPVVEGLTRADAPSHPTAASRDADRRATP